MRGHLEVALHRRCEASRELARAEAACYSAATRKQARQERVQLRAERDRARIVHDTLNDLITEMIAGQS